MQAASPLPLSSTSRDSSAEVSGMFEHDLIAKLKINDEENIENETEEKPNKYEDENEDEEDEEEFSFVLTNLDGSPISADDAFDNGQIRPVFPFFNRDLLSSDDYEGVGGIRSPVKKVFVQQPDDSPSSSSSSAATEGPYCEWTPKTAVKSNSTGFSKLWRLRDVKLRSNSDGKDAFVFLNHGPKPEKERNVVVKKVEVRKTKTTTSSTSSAHEKHYVMNRARKESDKRKSYLPYRQDLFGFFANANGLSRNVHPY
ncbi:hypothetical protein RJT34_06627 [Clitoria ternatea]|uniref:Uncharacterized protein n=1 Tax=Clitoria ternatea TaxID=43366 RepID=A0AAN9K4B2_CLITE